MNSRGLDLQPTDIIKADTIGNISSALQNEYNDRWEDMEVELGRDGFNDLFAYVRMLYAKNKAKRALLEEFRLHVLPQISSPDVLVSEVLEPYAEALATIKKSNYEAQSHADAVNTNLHWLNRIDNSDWMPPAMLFLSQWANEPEYVAWFFERLERLAAYMHVCARNVNERIERYAVLISGLENKHFLAEPVAEIELDESEKEQMRRALAGNIYLLTARRRNYVILRLDSFLSDSAASYDASILTIEHVLPQTVTDDSEWAHVWPDSEERERWLHRIANLLPLNKRRNSQAQNYDFEKKKEVYFSGKANVSSYTLTTQVLAKKSWTPDVMEARQKKLLDVMYSEWDLE